MNMFLHHVLCFLLYLHHCTHAYTHCTALTPKPNSFICHIVGHFSLRLLLSQRYLLKHVCIIKHAEHGAAICAQCDTRGKGSHTELTGASICMEEHVGNTR